MKTNIFTNKREGFTRTARLTSWLVLSAFFLQFPAAIAAPDARETMQGTIEQELERRYERETPGLKPSVADRMLDMSSKGVRHHVASMLTDFKMALVNGADHAYNGDSVVVIGAKNGWKLFKEYGAAAGINYLDSIYLLPKKAVKIGKTFGKAGQNIGNTAAKNAKHTAQVWDKTGKKISAAKEELKDGTTVLNMLAKDAYKKAGRKMAEGIRSGAEDAIEWSHDVYDWTIRNTADAAFDLTYGTVENVKRTGRWTSRVGKFWVEETADAARSVGDWSREMWDFTYNATSKTWEATKSSGSTVFKKSTGFAANTAEWLKDNTTLPARQARDGISGVSKWNWKKGYTQGLKEGIDTGRDAWNHDDRLMGTLWAVSGVGKAVLHVLLLEPTIVPVIAAYGVAGTAALATLGYPSVGAMYAGGTIASGLTYAGGTLATGTVAVGGTALTVAAGGAGSVRTVGTAAVGVTATAGTAVGGTLYTGGAAVVNGVRTVGTPFAGLIGMTGAAAAGGAEIVGATVWGGAKFAGITALTGLGYTVLTGYEVGKMLFSAVQAVGVTVFDNAIMTPVGVVTNLAQALGSGTWTLVEDPIYGTLDLLAAGGVAIGTIVTSTGAFSYELLKGMLTGLAHGVAAVGHSGIWIVGAVAKAGEFVYAAFNIPKHREWADFRRPEVREAFERIKKDAGKAMSDRFGEVILIRVSWWGSDRGRVRFFITKNKKTKERWYFKRAVDPETCEILYKVTNQDPVVRALSSKPWTGIYETGTFHRGCENAKRAN